jgi:hypothetical protein
MGKNVPPKHDYDTMRHAYLTTDVSLRGLAKEHGASFATVAAYARRHGWDDARAKYRVLQDEKSLEAFADRRAKKVADMERDAFEVIHAAILKMGLDMEDRWVTDEVTGERRFIAGMQITPEALTRLLDKYLVMTGNVTDRRANLGLNVAVGSGDSGIPREVLRELRDLALTKGAGGKPVGQSPLPRIEGAKQVN